MTFHEAVALLPDRVIRQLHPTLRISEVGRRFFLEGESTSMIAREWDSYPKLSEHQKQKRAISFVSFVIRNLDLVVS